MQTLNLGLGFEWFRGNPKYFTPWSEKSRGGQNAHSGVCITYSKKSYQCGSDLTVIRS